MKRVPKDNTSSAAQIPVFLACDKCKANIAWGQRECLNCKTAVVSGLPRIIDALLGTLIWFVLTGILSGIIVFISSLLNFGLPYLIVAIFALIILRYKFGVQPFMAIYPRMARPELMLQKERAARTEETKVYFAYGVFPKNWEKDSFSFSNILQDVSGSFYFKKDKVLFLAYLTCEETSEEVKKSIHEAIKYNKIGLNVVQALGEIDDKRAIKSLIAFLNDELKVIRENASLALQKITGQDFGENHDRWLKWQQEEAN